MDARTRAFVRDRADNRCEYCHIRQSEDPIYPLHIEHVIPRQHEGGDEPENLALACYFCNLHKGPNLTAIDPETKTSTPLFNPRLQIWEEHFELNGPLVSGRTPTGRATAKLFRMNDPRRIYLRGRVTPTG
jgi:hypothetical protein